MSSIPNSVGMIVGAPGRSLQKAAEVLGAKIDSADQKFEHSAVGNNGVGHFVGGAVQAPLEATVGVVNLVGAVLDGHLVMGAANAVRHPMETAKLIGSIPGQIVDSFTKRPAHSAGAAMMYLTGGLVAGSKATFGKSVKEGLQGYAKESAQRFDFGVNDLLDGGRGSAVSTGKAVYNELRGKSRGILADAHTASVEGRIAAGARLGHATQRVGQSVYDFVDKSPLPFPVKTLAKLPARAVRFAGGRGERVSNTPTGRLALSSSVEPNHTSKARE